MLYKKKKNSLQQLFILFVFIMLMLNKFENKYIKKKLKLYL
jgi:hypothetical protein